jgi:arylsulfatase A-like enzyme
MVSLRRGLLLGIAFGFAVAIVDLGLLGLGTLERRMGPGPAYMLRIAALEVGLAALVGLALPPLLRLRFGRVLGVAALGLAWLALGLLVEFDAPLGKIFAVAPPVAGVALVLAGLALARVAAWLPWAAASLLLVGVAAGPQAWIDATSAAHTAHAATDAELPPAPEGAPDVVLVVLDTVRAPNTSAYGHTRATTPTLEALASEGALFADATSPATWSLPSHASLFTGRYPSSHGAHGENLLLDDRYPTLAQVLASRGFETTCFTANAWISDGLGLTRGFAWQDAAWRTTAGAGRNFGFVNRLLDRLGLIGGDKGGALVAERFGEWMRARPRDARPAFVFLNFIEAHFPYHQLPEPYLHQFTDIPESELEELSMALMAQQFGGPGRDPAEAAPPARDMYDGGVLYADELLRRVVEAIRDRGTLDRTVLVVLADHGELLGERAGYFGHGPSLYQEMVSVPLVVRFPPRIPAGRRVETPVSTLGVFATVLDLAGLEAPPTLQVGSLVPLAVGTLESAAAGAAPNGGGPVLAENMMNTVLGGGDVSYADAQMKEDRRYRAYRSGSWKLVETSKGEEFLFDLASDPGETRDLAAARPVELARLRAELETVRGRIGLPELDGDLAGDGARPELDEETQERLRELGYLE